MRENILEPLPFVTGRYDKTNEEMPLTQRLFYVAACMEADVTGRTILAITPSPFRMRERTGVIGLAAKLDHCEQQMEEERECYDEIYYMIRFLDKCINAVGFDEWYSVNSLLMRQLAYVVIQFMVGFKRMQHFRAVIEMVWLRCKSPGRYVAATTSRQVKKETNVDKLQSFLIYPCCY
jgi:hypothetical protein